MKVKQLAYDTSEELNICLHYADGKEEIGHAPDFYDNDKNIGIIELRRKEINGIPKTCLYVYVMPDF